MLDPIFTTLAKYYQQPEAKPPLDNDPEKNGKPSDHDIIIMKPITSVHNIPARRTKSVKFRPLPQSGIDKMSRWIQTQSWEDIFNAETAHDKAQGLKDMLMDKLNEYLPEKKNNKSDKR